MYAAIPLYYIGCWFYKQITDHYLLYHSAGDSFGTPSSGTVPSASVPGNPIIPIKYYSIENLDPSLAAKPLKIPPFIGCAETSDLISYGP
jgi:hypothetical protein